MENSEKGKEKRENDVAQLNCKRAASKKGNK